MKETDIGKTITELRKSKGITQEYLAEKCGISTRSLQRIEAGKVEPRDYTKKIIFDFLNDLEEPSLNNIKNEAPKKTFKSLLTKKTIISSSFIVCFVVVLSLIIPRISFLSKYDLGRLETSFITYIDVEIPNVPDNVKIVKIVEPQNDFAIERGSFTDGRLQIDLSFNMLSRHVYLILRKSTHNNINKSNDTARFCFANIMGYDGDGNRVGEFIYRGLEPRFELILFYSDRNVTITGVDNSNDIWHVSLKTGWNKLFHVTRDDGQILMTTKEPIGGEWIFRRL